MKEFFYRLFTKIAYADTAGSGGAGGEKFLNPLGPGATDFKIVIDRILEVLIAIGIPVLVLFIVYAGFLFVTAAGSEEKIKTAKNALWWAIIGGAVLIGARVIATVVQSTVGAI